MHIQFGLCKSSLTYEELEECALAMEEAFSGSEWLPFTSGHGPANLPKWRGRWGRWHFQLLWDSGDRSWTGQVLGCYSGSVGTMPSEGWAMFSRQSVAYGYHPTMMAQAVRSLAMMLLVHLDQQRPGLKAVVCQEEYDAQAS